MALSDKAIATAENSGEEIYRFSSEHAGTKALHDFLGPLAEAELSREKLLTFFASMVAFVGHITPGIPALASRLSDALMPVARYDADRIAATILAAAMDEYGLTGTKPHAELLRDFALYFDLTEEEFTDPENAVPAACELGSKMFVWYRQSAIPYALGVHCASEVTGYDEAQGFYRAFLSPPKYGLTAETPAFTYVATHAENEEDHSKGTVICLNEYLALFPDHEQQILAGSLDYMTLYQRMFEDMRERIFDTP